MKAVLFQHRLRVFASGLIGFAAGMINALLGAAGGILLVYTMPHVIRADSPLPAPFSKSTAPRMESRDHLATSLSVTLPISLFSFTSHWMNGVRPNLSTLIWLIVPAGLGGLLGAWLLGRIRADFLRRLFAIVVIVSGFRMLF